MEIKELVNTKVFRNFAKRVIIMAAVATVAGIVMYLLKVKGGEVLITLGFGTLAVMSVLLVPNLPCPGEPNPHEFFVFLWRLTMYFVGIGIAGLMIGILFVLSHWPGGISILIVGMGSILLGAVSYIFYRKKREKEDNGESPLQN